MTKIAVIIGSTRPNRFGPKVAQWFVKQAGKTDQAHFELVDIADFGLPIYDEPIPAGNSQPHTKKWQAKMAEFDGYVLVVSENNHSFSASLKNGLDYTSDQFHYKPVGYVGYGSVGAVRSIEQLRQVAANFKQYDLRTTVLFMGQGNFDDNDADLKVEPAHLKSAESLAKDISFWAQEMAPIRRKLLPN